MKKHNYQWSIIQTRKQNYLEVFNIDRIPTINEVFLIYTQLSTKYSRTILTSQRSILYKLDTQLRSEYSKS